MAFKIIDHFRGSSGRSGRGGDGGITKIFGNMSPGLLARVAMRLLQFAMGIAVIGLYAQDLDRARKAGKYVDSKWAYAVAVGTFGAIAAVALGWLRGWFYWFVDAFACLLYLILFGIFGKMYISEDPEGNKGIIRMKNAVWVDLANVFLWFCTACYGLASWRFQKRKSPNTGAAMSQV